MLEGSAPQALLPQSWLPEHAGAQRVRTLAEAARGGMVAMLNVWAPYRLCFRVCDRRYPFYGASQANRAVAGTLRAIRPRLYLASSPLVA